MSTTIPPLSGLVAMIAANYITTHPAQVAAMTKSQRDALYELAYGTPCPF